MNKVKQQAVKFWIGLFFVLSYILTNILHTGFGLEFTDKFLQDMQYLFYIGIFAMLGIEFFEQLVKVVIAYKKGDVPNKTDKN